MSTLPILTDDEYKDAAVARCPVCRNEDLEYGDVDFSGKWISHEVMCNECDSEWYDVYLLQGYENLDVHGKARAIHVETITAEITARLKKEAT